MNHPALANRAVPAAGFGARHESEVHEEAQAAFME